MGNNCCATDNEIKYSGDESDNFRISKDPLFRKHQLSKKTKLSKNQKTEF